MGDAIKAFLIHMEGKIQIVPSEVPTEKILTPDEIDQLKNIYFRFLSYYAKTFGGKPYQTNPEIIEATRKVFYYAIQHTESCKQLDVNLSKGIIICGNTGSGKTLLFRAWEECKRTKEISSLFANFLFFTSRDVAFAYEKEGAKALGKWTEESIRYNGSTLFPVHALFDDLGNEDAVMHFGNRKETMETIICERYDKWIKHGVISHFTTNLDRQQIADKYGERALSRLIEMCNWVYLGAKADSIDFRKP
jgi:DNA replication protein DnaC